MIYFSRARDAGSFDSSSFCSSLYLDFTTSSLCIWKCASALLHSTSSFFFGFSSKGLFFGFYISLSLSSKSSQPPLNSNCRSLSLNRLFYKIKSAWSQIFSKWFSMYFIVSYMDLVLSSVSNCSLS
jgi:hypothetical protein